MNQTEFVKAIKIAVSETSKRSVLVSLQKPAGRQPQQEAILMSDWFNALSQTDKIMVDSIIKEAVDTSVFGMLCVLDGVRAIENGASKGALKLYYEKDGQKILLNGPNAPVNLHDLI